MAPVERCTNHTFEVADRLCGDCGRPFCGMCLVTPFPRKPPLCHQCAVAAAGIRTGARTTPVRSRREIKAFERERRQAEARQGSRTPGEGGFGPAKPAITPGPSRTPNRNSAADRAQAAPATAETNEDTGADEKTSAAVRSRPLRGLAR